MIGEFFVRKDINRFGKCFRYKALQKNFEMSMIFLSSLDDFFGFENVWSIKLQQLYSLTLGVLVQVSIVNVIEKYCNLKSDLFFFLISFLFLFIWLWSVHL